MGLEKVLEDLERLLIPEKKIQQFSEKPGIYAIGFFGQKFPLLKAKDYVSKKPIIYLGKTESSQLQRDKKTHFTSGKSGSSTLRRTLGAILRVDYELIPIPRNINEKSDRKFRNYKFTEAGEDHLTQWMRDNLSMSFWEFEDSTEELERTEKHFIKQYVPVLNLKNNPKNPFKQTISALRKECKILAEQDHKGDS